VELLDQEHLRERTGKAVERRGKASGASLRKSKRRPEKNTTWRFSVSSRFGRFAPGFGGRLARTRRRARAHLFL
jgi:hypothetical protein